MMAKKIIKSHIKNQNSPKMNLIKNAIIQILIFTLFNNLNAQTFIGLTVGLDISKLHPNYDVNQYVTHESYKFNEYKFSSFSPGIVIEQKFGKYVSLNINSSFTFKKLEINKNNVDIFEIPIYDYKFTYLKNSIVLKIYPLQYVYFGLGRTFNYSCNFRYNFGSDGKFEEYLKNFKEYGWLFSIGLDYKNFILEVNYSKSEYNEFNKNNYINTDDFKLKPINSLQINIGYLFKIFTTPKFEIENKVKCPNFNL